MRKDPVIRFQRIRASLEATVQIGRSTIVLFVLLLLALLVINAALIIQNRSLRSFQVIANRTGLKAGSVAPTLAGLDIDGNKLAFAFGGNNHVKSILFVLSPRCAYCEKNMSNWKAITNRIDSKSYRIIAVSLVSEGLKEYLEKHQMAGISVIAELDPRSTEAYGFNLTPQTLLIDSDGRVENIWTGILEPNDLRELGLGTSN